MNKDEYEELLRIKAICIALDSTYKSLMGDVKTLLLSQKTDRETIINLQNKLDTLENK